MNSQRRGQLAIWFIVSVVLLSGPGCVAQPSNLSMISNSGIENTFDELNEDDKLKNQSYESLLEKGHQYLENGDYKLARIHFVRAQALEKAPVQALNGLGETALRASDTTTAREAFLEALEFDDHNQPALLGIGKVSRIQGKYEQAEDFLKLALAEDPEDPEVLTEMAITYDSYGQGAVAEPLFEKVVELQPDSSSALNNLGFNRLLQGKYSSAVSALIHARSMNPSDKMLKNNLAAAYILNGEELAGLNLFESSVGQAAAFNNVGYIYLTQEKWAAAERAFARAMEISPSYYIKANKNLSYMKNLHKESIGQATGPQP